MTQDEGSKLRRGDKVFYNDGKRSLPLCMMVAQSLTDQDATATADYILVKERQGTPVFDVPIRCIHTTREEALWQITKESEERAHVAKTELKLMSERAHQARNELFVERARKELGK